MEVVPGAAEQRVLAGALLGNSSFPCVLACRLRTKILDSNPAARKVIFEV